MRTYKLRPSITSMIFFIVGLGFGVIGTYIQSSNIDIAVLIAMTQGLSYLEVTEGE